MENVHVLTSTLLKTLSNAKYKLNNNNIYNN